ncbi:MAG: hypothetical protein AAF202_00505 [Pseudomonadota bacterium]
MKTTKLVLATIVSVFLLCGLSANASVSEESNFMSAEEVEGLLIHLGLFDEQAAELEESIEFGTEAPIELMGKWRKGRHHRDWDRGRGRHRDRDWDRGGRRRWDDDDHWDRRRPRPARVVCWVRNARGHMFRGRGQSPRVARNRAARKCYSRSRACYSAGCRWR